MEISPYVKAAGVGIAGYAFALGMRKNPQLTALIWLVSEAAMQAFNLLLWGKPKQKDRWAQNVIVGIVASVAMHQYNMISALAHLAITAAVCAGASFLMGGHNSELKVTYQL